MKILRTIQGKTLHDRIRNEDIRNMSKVQNITEILRQGRKLIEVNGKIVLNKTREDLARLLSAAPDPAQIVLLRTTKNNQNDVTSQQLSSAASEEVAALRSELGVVRERAEETQKAKDGLISDNIRLTHRISYLEEQVSELLSRKNPETPEIRVVSQSPVITSMVKTTQNVTNINISSQPHAGSPNNTNSNDLQIFQKGPQVTALVANLPGLDVSKESHTALPVRSKSSLSNVSNTHIPAPSPQPSENYSCHKSHRHRHRSPKTKSTHELNESDAKPVYRNHHHHSSRDKEYYSETSGNDHSKEHRRSTDFNQKASLMDQSYKKASMIVHDLTKVKENGYDSVYEKHRQKCISASEKYNTHLLKHYNSRKSASVLDFRSQMNSRYRESRSSDRLDGSENEKSSEKHIHHRRITDARSVKSLDFDSDCNTPRGQEKIIDYTSEPIDSLEKPHHYHPTYLDNIKPRPTPPKKPLRLSLHKTQSLQSVETPTTTPSGSPDKNDSRKPLKRNHRGETQYIPLLNVKIEGSSGRHKSGHKDYLHKSVNGLSALKWSHFSSTAKYIENGK